MRVAFLCTRIQSAKNRNDEKAVKDIERMLRREAQAKQWKRLKHSTKKDQGGAVYSVRVQSHSTDDDEVYETEDGIFKNVSTHLAERFRLVFSAPCHSGKLFDNIGFIGDTEAAQQILEGTYEYEEGLDPATRLLFEEAAKTYASMPREKIATFVTAEDFQYYWQRANERISSSYSGLHFGYYEAAAFDPELSALHAANLTL